MMQQVWDLLPTVARKCLQEEYELCRDEHVIHRMIPVLLGLERQNQLAGLSGTQMDAVMAEGLDLARKCLHFELRFESSAEGTITGPTGVGTFTSDMEATVPIELEGSLSARDAKFKGSAPLDNTDFEFTASTEGACTSEEVPGGGTFTLMALNWEATPPDESHPYGTVKDIQLNYAPGWSTEALIAHCGGITSPLMVIPTWSTAFMASHMSEISSGAGSPGMPPMPDLSSLLGGNSALPGGAPPPSPGGSGAPGEGGASGPTFEAKGWDVMGDALFAVKEWSQSTTVDSSTLSDEGTMELHHKPQ
jgi:hypothetical protein